LWGAVGDDDLAGVLAVADADAGYTEAQQCADNLNVPVPMRTW
jgi:hypothetical protein